MPLLLSRVLAGYDKRKHELDQESHDRERESRRGYLDHLNRRLDEALSDGDDDVVEWITAERERVHSTDPGKPYKPKPVPLPMRLSGKPAPGTTAAKQAGQQPGMTPPDVHQLSRAVVEHYNSGGATGGAQLTATPTGGEFTPGGIGADVPPMTGSGPLGAPAPAMPSAEGTMAPLGAPAPAGTPPGAFGAPSPLPAQAATPPGRSLPEPSPLVGMARGGMTPPGAGPAPNAAEPTAVRRARLKGQAEAAGLEPVLDLQRRMGMSKGGRLLLTPPSAKDIATAADKGLGYVRNEDGSYSTRPLDESELSLVSRSKLGAASAHQAHLHAQEALWAAEIDHKRAMASGKRVDQQLARERLDVARANAATAKQNADSIKRRLDIDSELYGITPPSGAGGAAGATGATGGNAGGSGGPATPTDPNVRTTVTNREYVDLTGLTGKMKSAWKMKYESMGVTALDAPEAETVRQIDTTRLNQDTIWSTITEKLPRDASGRVLGGLENRLEAFFQTDEELAAYSSFRAAAIQSLYSLAGGRGFRLNKLEIDLALKNDIPQITDTVAVAQQKLRNLTALLDNKENSLLVPRRAGMRGSTGAAGPTRSATPPSKPATAPSDTFGLR